MRISSIRHAPILLFQFGWGQEPIFDNHVHIWNGEESVKEYLAQLDSTNQAVTRFGGIHMAMQGKLEETRKKMTN